jgi:hypothetical protein
VDLPLRALAMAGFIWTSRWANIYGKEFPVTDKNRMVELTMATATTYKRLDSIKMDLLFLEPR